MPKPNPIIARDLQDTVLSLIEKGVPNTEIMRQLSLPRNSFYAWKRSLRKGDGLGTLKQKLKLELSQEHALSELSKQMEEYTENYELAMKKHDEKAAYAWSQRRIDLLEKMLKVTGAYSEKERKDEGVQFEVFIYEKKPDDEVKQCPDTPSGPA